MEPLTEEEIRVAEERREEQQEEVQNEEREAEIEQQEAPVQREGEEFTSQEAPDETIESEPLVEGEEPVEDTPMAQAPRYEVEPESEEEEEEEAAPPGVHHRRVHRKHGKRPQDSYFMSSMNGRMPRELGEPWAPGNEIANMYTKWIYKKPCHERGETRHDNMHTCISAYIHA